MDKRIIKKCADNGKEIAIASQNQNNFGKWPQEMKEKLVEIKDEIERGLKKLACLIISERFYF